MYTGPAYKVRVLEGKHRGETIRSPADYVQRAAGGPPTPPRQPSSLGAGIEEMRFESGGQKYVRYFDTVNKRQWTVKL